MSDEQWSVIAENDSIAFNSWVRHSFVPSFYLIQDVSKESLALFSKRNYDKTLFLLRGCSFGQSRPNVQLIEDLLSFARACQVRTVVEFPIDRAFEELPPNDVVHLLSAMDILRHGGISRVLPKFRGTLGMAVAFGYLMGYEKIVICGSNPKSPGYFWDKDKSIRRIDRKSHMEYLASELWTLESEWYMNNSQTSYIAAIDELMHSDGVGGVYSGSAVAADYGLANFWGRLDALGAPNSTA